MGSHCEELKSTFHCRQHAYKKDNPAEAPLHEITAEVEEEISEKKDALGAFIDVEGDLNYNITCSR